MNLWWLYMFLCVSISFYQYSSAWRFILNWTIAVQYHRWFKHWKKIQPLPDICTMLLLLLMPKNKQYLWLLFTYLLVFFFFLYLPYFTLLRWKLSSKDHTNKSNYEFTSLDGSFWRGDVKKTSSNDFIFVFFKACPKVGPYLGKSLDINLYTLYWKSLLINEFTDLLLNYILN